MEREHDHPMAARPNTIAATSVAPRWTSGRCLAQRLRTITASAKQHQHGIGDRPRTGGLHQLPGTSRSSRVLWNMATWSVLQVNLLILLLQFRLVSILAADREPLISQETRPIRTLPYGLPARPPLDFVIFAVDSSSISFSWNPPTNTNGPLLSYVLTIQEKPNGYRALKVITFIRTVNDTFSRFYVYLFIFLNESVSIFH